MLHPSLVAEWRGRYVAIVGGEEVDVERWAEGVGWPTHEARPIDLLATGEERIVPPVEAIIASPEQNPRNTLVWVQVGPCTSDDTKRRYRFVPEGITSRSKGARLLCAASDRHLASDGATALWPTSRLVCQRGRDRSAPKPVAGRGHSRARGSRSAPEETPATRR